MGLIACLRGAGTGQIRIALVLSMALHAGVVGYALAYLPIMPLRPTCADMGASLFPYSTDVDGEMAFPFFRALHDEMAGRRYFTSGTRIYVTVADWFDRDEISQISSRATYKLLMERTGVSHTDISYQRAGIPEFDEVSVWPPCGAMRKLAIKGGEWTYRGPELKPEVARGRLVPLPHLTDPLLFEPVRPREPDAAGEQGDAGSR